MYEKNIKPLALRLEVRTPATASSLQHRRLRPGPSAPQLSAEQLPHSFEGAWALQLDPSPSALSISLHVELYGLL